MPRQIVLRSVDRRQAALLMQSKEYSSKGGRRVGEVAGGTMAECAAVCCCCPCGLANLLVLVVYKVPAGLCRKAMRKKRRRRLMKEGLLPPRRIKCSCDCDEELHVHPALVTNSPLSFLTSSLDAAAAGGPDNNNSDLIDLEKEMWDQFYSAGFWRSPSQRSDVSAAVTI